MLAGIPDFHAELIRSVDGGDTTWSEWSWSGNRAEPEPPCTYPKPVLPLLAAPARCYCT